MRRVLWLVLVLAAGIGGVPAAADAAFPGPNGPIAFIGANGALTAVGPDGGQATRLAPASVYNARYSPDGSQLVMRRDHPTLGGGTSMATVNADGTNQTFLPQNGLEPWWTADGRIVYAGLVNNEYEIVRANADGSGAQPLTSTPGVFLSSAGPVASVDGTVFFTRRYSTEPVTSRIFSVPLAGGPATEVPTPAGLASISDVSPDGTRILYAHVNGSTRELRQRTLVGGAESVVATGFIGGAAFSPDGKQIAYMASRPSPSPVYYDELRQVGVDGTGNRAVPLVDGPGTDVSRMVGSLNWGTSGIVVTETSDEDDAAPADAVCDVDLATAGPQCTLRAAIDLANATEDEDTISFDVEDGGFQTIAVESALPEITTPVVVDGTSQPGAPDGEPGIGLDGAGAGDADGLRVGGADSTVRGLVIHGFEGTGIVLGGDGGHTVAGSWIGFERAAGGGYDRDGNGSGVDVAAPDVTIGGAAPADRNVISANGNPAGAKAFVDGLEDETQAQLHDVLANVGTGVVISDDDATRVTVRGNWLGVDPSGGRFDQPGGLTSTFGVAVGPEGGILTDVTIRDNTISGHVFGVWAVPDPATAGVVDGLTVSGNRIGTTPTGAAGPGLGGAVGVVLQDRVSRATVTDNDIGGQAVGLMAVKGGPTVTGNRIGVDEDIDGLVGGLSGGSATLGKHNILGVLLADTDGAVIGGPGSQGNAILGNVLGVMVAGDQAGGNAVLGNTIGLGSPPATPVKDMTVGDAGSVLGVVLGGGTGTDVGDPGAGNTIQGTGLGILAVKTTGGHVQANRLDHNVVGVMGLQAQDWEIGGFGPAGNELLSGSVGAWLIGWSPTAAELRTADVGGGAPVQREDRDRALTAPQAKGALALAAVGSSADLEPGALDLADPPGGTAARGTAARRASTGTRIRGNAIGVTREGAAAPNYVGAWLFGTHTDAAITDNTIARNHGGGLWLGSPVQLGSGVPEPTGVTVRANRIFENFSPGNSLTGVPALGLDLLEPRPDELAQQGFGVTANDDGDVDGGVNGRQNTPVLVTALRSGDQVTVTGTLASKPGTAYLIDLYANQRCNAFGSGEGELPVGSEPIPVTTGPDGRAAFSKTVTAATAYTRVTATATGPEGTSELSACATIADAPPVDPGPGPGPGTPTTQPPAATPTPAPPRDTGKPDLGATPKGKPAAGGPVTVSVTSDEAATVTATGTQTATTPKPAGKANAAKRITVKLKRVRKAVGAGKRVAVTLKPTGKPAIRALRRAVRRGAKATATIRLVLVDRAGNRRARTLRVKLR